MAFTTFQLLLTLPGGVSAVTFASARGEAHGVGEARGFGEGQVVGSRARLAVFGEFALGEMCLGGWTQPPLPEMTGMAFGIGTAIGRSAVIIAARGVASGIGTAQGTGSLGGGSAAGTAVGIGSASGTGVAIASGRGVASGVGSASATTETIVSGDVATLGGFALGSMAIGR